ncbi:hypothetical protein Y032_0598g464 [Ancylostoma ceylanicum]|uniref:Uncharacterized protein n=1 Tax=Ancylostoma ceylanicum TaxID=53326 RepID=A0A016WMG2_9BILA|nr:hypothetical protein Y032_0598g464 [Ancylostoma ceylanicum]
MPTSMIKSCRTRSGVNSGDEVDDVIVLTVCASSRYGSERERDFAPFVSLASILKSERHKVTSPAPPTPHQITSSHYE